MAKYLPTRKWLAATVVGITGLLVLFVQHGWHLDEHTSIAVITVLSQRALAWIVPNQDTPGGVPVATRARRAHRH